MTQIENPKSKIQNRQVCPACGYGLFHSGHLHARGPNQPPLDPPIEILWCQAGCKRHWLATPAGTEFHDARAHAAQYTRIPTAASHREKGEAPDLNRQHTPTEMS